MSSRASVLALLLIAPVANAQQQLTIAGYGWTVTADYVHSSLSVAHERLGPVLRDGHLGLRSTGAVMRWTAEPNGEGQLLIRSSNPPVSWGIELGADALTVTSTSNDALLSARAPAPPTRIPARLLDRTGTPVFWCGNGEIRSTYGAEAPCLPSFIPHQNGDVMYFSLGQVSHFFGSFRCLCFRLLFCPVFSA
jgi:hypothetical protein